jgi:3-hydroxyacyl-CoA dehydrogenase/enoyl-CoA hydratase/carnithine racemase
MPDAVALSWLESDIGVITFDQPDRRVNVLSSAVLEQFERLLSEAESRGGVSGLIIRSAKPGQFIAGADLHEIAALKGESRDTIVALSRRGQSLLARVSQLPFVTVAAIDGMCLGGGTELALWCDQRIVTDSPRTQIGLPEVKLGLVPGWGGTVRAARIVGLPLALELILSGEPVSGEVTVRDGLAVDVVPADQLLDAAVQTIRDEQRTGEYLRQRSKLEPAAPFNAAELELLRLSWTDRIKRESHGQDSVEAQALELMLTLSGTDTATALQLEAETFARLFTSPVCSALLNVHFLADRNKRDPGIDHAAFKPGPVRSLGVIGAGIMGAGIAAAALRRGLPASITDSRPDVVQKMVPQILQEAAYDKGLKSANRALAIELASLLHGGSESILESCDLVIEAIVENLDVKKQLFARIEPRLSADAILASNTSTIPISQLAQGLMRPDRFCGMHFFNPVSRMKLVEVIRGAQTSDDTIARAVTLAKQLGKMPVVVNDGPGFMVNRLLFPYMNEAIELLHDGLSIDQIDRSAVSFGMPLGPIALYDMVGLDTAMYAGRTMYNAFPSRVAASPLVPAFVKRGRLGQKTGKGFFNHENDQRTPQPDPAVAKLLEDYTRRSLHLTDEQVQHRLFLPMLLEATRLLEEHVARDVRDIDLGLIYGLGFPATKGGLLYWADSLGAKQLLKMLEPFESLGSRMQATPLLLSMAESGRTFYGQ